MASSERLVDNGRDIFLIDDNAVMLNSRRGEIFVIDDDVVMRECIVKACGERKVCEFDNALAAMNAIIEGALPNLIIMDVMLTGPDGFSFLNELISYEDTARIPIVIVSAVDFGERDLSVYGVVESLLKDNFVPNDVRRLVKEYA